MLCQPDFEVTDDKKAAFGPLFLLSNFAVSHFNVLPVKLRVVLDVQGQQLQLHLGSCCTPALKTSVLHCATRAG